MIAPDDPRRGSRRRQGFSHKDKLVAVVASEINGIPETAKALRVTQQSLRKWRDDAELEPYVREAQRQIMGDVTAASQKAWELTLLRLQNEPDDISTRDLLAIASESTNKMQLLSGGATSRQETRDVTDHFDEAQTQEIVNAARRYLERHGPGARSAMAEVGRLEIPAKTVSDPA